MFGCVPFLFTAVLSPEEIPAALRMVSAREGAGVVNA